MTKAQMVNRAALAEAIKRHAAADRELARKHQALSNARTLLSGAAAKLAAAKADCEAAKVEHKARVMDAASTSSDLKPSPKLRDARLREAEAQDECDAAQDAVAEMELALNYEPSFVGSPTDPVTLAARDVECEVDKVIRQEVDLTPLLDECDRLLTELIDKRQAAVYLVSQGLIEPERMKHWGPRLAMRTLPSVGLVGFVEDPRFHSSINTDQQCPTMEAWKAARLALRSDAATPFPSDPSSTTVAPLRKAS